MAFEDDDDRQPVLTPDELEGGRRRLRRVIVFGVVLAITVIAYGLATMMR